MWISLDETQLEHIKAAMEACAANNDRDVALFWTDEHKELRTRLETEAKEYRAIGALITAAISEHDPDDPYRVAAQERATDDFEVDGDAVVSPGDDAGAFVMAWTWVSDEAAGRFTCEECDSVFTIDRRSELDCDVCDECAKAADDEDGCSECGEPLDEAGDGYDGMCADCADKATTTDTYPENWTKDDG